MGSSARRHLHPGDIVAIASDSTAPAAASLTATSHTPAGLEQPRGTTENRAAPAGRQQCARLAQLLLGRPPQAPPLQLKGQPHRSVRRGVFESHENFWPGQRGGKGRGQINGGSDQRRGGGGAAEGAEGPLHERGLKAAGGTGDRADTDQRNARL